MRYGDQEPELLGSGRDHGTEEPAPLSEHSHGSRLASLVTAETLSIASFLASIPTLVGMPGAIQTFVLAMSSNVESFSGGLVLGFGAAATVCVLLAWGSLYRSQPSSQPWAHWLAGGVLLVELPVLAAAAVAWIAHPAS